MSTWGLVVAGVTQGFYSCTRVHHNCQLQPWALASISQKRLCSLQGCWLSTILHMLRKFKIWFQQSGFLFSVLRSLFEVCKADAVTKMNNYKPSAQMWQGANRFQWFGSSVSCLGLVEKSSFDLYNLHSSWLCLLWSWKDWPAYAHFVSGLCTSVLPASKMLGGGGTLELVFWQ